MLLWCVPSSFSSIWLTVWEMSFEAFQDGDHLGYRNRMILAILNVHVAPVPPTKFNLGSIWFRVQEKKCGFKIFKKLNDFSNSESPCHSNASHQVSAQSNLQFWRCLKLFKMAILDIRMERFKQFWISMSLWCLPSSFSSIWHGLGGYIVWRISRRPSCILEWNDSSNSEPLCRPDASHEASAQSAYGSGDVAWKLSRWPLWWSSWSRPSWISERNDFSNSVSLGCLPSSFGSIRLTVWEELLFKGFQEGCHGGHLGYRNEQF